ncbi:hypothetical protein AIOL_001148 [Candidatus Rhodobacter oscarellae]|uniref:2,4-dihydroxyhept-2-ene-1,7-dioic acid aldolase n=1 Tax=Candidatus Rhodobacter oscarellae TaxID=1675527 RepID=A0A0J9DZV2_9RHOB|nr:DUF2218 domain-containing protein [Candidatus Rhodobacter lobularis]KMW56196.1 hypothetical protein AIOL_001148 [Candidatus Rhodobacter lobularis]
MSQTTAIVATKNASRYLQQLCKHFAHKVEVEFTRAEGTVTLPFGTCRLSADPEHLSMSGASEADNLPRLERFLENHLARFAFRENPTIEWQRSI